MKTFYTPSGREVKKVGIYRRVSSRKQEDKISLANQLEKSQKFALEHGLEIVVDKPDTNPGWAIDARGPYNELLALGDDGLIDGIVVDVSDRLARADALPSVITNAKLCDLVVLIADKGGPLSLQDQAIEMLVSGRDNTDRARRVTETKLQYALQGKVIFSKPGYGIKLIKEFDPESGKKTKTTIEFVDERIQVVKDMFHWLAIDQMTIRDIQRQLYKNQVLPPRLTRKMEKHFGRVSWDDVPDEWKGKKGEKLLWSSSTIRYILTSETYTGRWFFNKRKTKGLEKKGVITQIVLDIRPRDQWALISLPPVVPESLFIEAQKVLQKNKDRHVGRPSKVKYLLRGLFFCSCGRRFTGNRTGQYRCTGTGGPISETKCGASYLSQKRAEAMVWDYIVLMLAHPERLIEEFDRKREDKERENAVLLRKVSRLTGEISKAQRALDRLVKMLAVGDIDRETFQRNKADFENSLETDTGELAETQAELQHEVVFDADDKARFSYALTKMWEVLEENPTFEEKRKTLLQLDCKITYLKEDHAIKIEGAFQTANLPIRRDYLDLEDDIALQRDEYFSPKSFTSPRQLERIPFVAELSLPKRIILDTRPERKPTTFSELLTENNSLLRPFAS